MARLGRFYPRAKKYYSVEKIAGIVLCRKQKLSLHQTFGVVWLRL